MFISGKKSNVWKHISNHFCQRHNWQIQIDFSCQNSLQLLGFYLQGACQLPPGCSALRHRRMPERPHPPEGNQPAAGPDPRPEDPPEPGHEPEERQVQSVSLPPVCQNQIDKNHFTNGEGVHKQRVHTFLPWSVQQSPLQSPQGCGCSGHAKRAASWCWKKMGQV